MPKDAAASARAAVVGNPSVLTCPSKSQVNKAGRIIRKAASGDPAARAQRDDALEILRAFRAMHQYSLTKATMGLRSVVATERCAKFDVTQRLKRAPTMVNKLLREPTMQLANMQDIGGCRAVLESLDELRRVERRLKRNRAPRRVADYINAPRSSGYRGVHVIVEYPDRTGVDRAIEVQLRTPAMHEWAITVERLSRPGRDLKSGDGPQPVLDLLEVISEAMSLEEAGLDVDQDLLDRMNALRGTAVPLLTGGHRGQ